MKIIKFEKSPKKNKKYRIYINYKNKIYHIDFGDIRYQQYKDSTPLKLYSHLNHGNKERRRLYLARAKGIKDKQGKLTKDNVLSPNYYSIRYLW